MLLRAECVSVPEKREGTLDVIVTDLTGRNIDGAEMELFAGEKRVAAVKSNRVPLQYGDYRLRVSATGFGSQWRDVRIAQQNTVVRVDLPLGHIGCAPAPATIGGKITVDGSASDVWVKVVPLRGTGGGEARVSPLGYFVVSGLAHSTYLLLVTRGESVLHHQIVKTYPMGKDTSQLSIHLPERH